MTRRKMLAVSVPLLALPSREAQLEPQAQRLGEVALKRLQEGNLRFQAAMSIHPDQNASRRYSLAMGQHPFAVILTCADSRVPPEIVFDQGLGDLFVIRVAGNIVDDAVLGSVEYAVEHLRVTLLLVLGHEGCGAVAAALKADSAPGHIGALVSAIRPAVAQARLLPGDPLDNSVRANVKLVVDQVRNSEPILAERIRSRQFLVAGGRYDLKTGAVDMLV